MDSGRGVGPGDGVPEFALAKGLFRTRDGPLGAGALIFCVWRQERQSRRVLLGRFDVAHYAGNAV